MIIEEESLLQYAWISQFLKWNYGRIWEDMFNIISMLEDKTNFINFIKQLPISSWVNVFIWEENIIPFLKDYTIILKPLMINWKVWYIWIIGSLKMNYSFNISAIRGII
jgi:transcriptional regulator of heat shock response